MKTISLIPMCISKPNLRIFHHIICNSSQLFPGLLLHGDFHDSGSPETLAEIYIDNWDAVCTITIYDYFDIASSSFMYVYCIYAE